MNTMKTILDNTKKIKIFYEIFKKNQNFPKFSKLPILRAVQDATINVRISVMTPVLCWRF